MQVTCIDQTFIPPIFILRKLSLVATTATDMEPAKRQVNSSLISRVNALLGIMEKCAKTDTQPVKLLRKRGIPVKMEDFAKTRGQVFTMNVSVLLPGKGNTVKYAPIYHPWYVIPVALTDFHSITSPLRENTANIVHTLCSLRKKNCNLQEKKFSSLFSRTDISHASFCNNGATH